MRRRLHCVILYIILEVMEMSVKDNVDTFIHARDNKRALEEERKKGRIKNACLAGLGAGFLASGFLTIKTKIECNRQLDEIDSQNKRIKKLDKITSVLFTSDKKLEPVVVELLRKKAPATLEEDGFKEICDDDNNFSEVEDDGC